VGRGGDQGKFLFFLTIFRYTASCGERRIRVHTAAAPVVSDLGEMYRQADTGAIVSLLGRLGNVRWCFQFAGVTSFEFEVNLRSLGVTC